jgi:hypothetical protein
MRVRLDMEIPIGLALCRRSGKKLTDDGTIFVFLFLRGSAAAQNGFYISDLF